MQLGNMEITKMSNNMIPHYLKVFLLSFTLTFIMVGLSKTHNGSSIIFSLENFALQNQNQPSESTIFGVTSSKIRSVLSGQ
jgi:hypothetical protein